MFKNDEDEEEETFFFLSFSRLLSVVDGDLHRGAVHCRVPPDQVS